MRNILQQSKAGFTLLEVLVAMVIMMVSLLGLFEAISIATAQNVKNQLRDEAVLIGEERMADMMRRPFGLLSTSTITAPSRIRGTEKPFIIERKADNILNTASYEFRVTVRWDYKNLPSHHEVRSMRTYINGR